MPEADEPITEEQVADANDDDAQPESPEHPFDDEIAERDEEAAQAPEPDESSARMEEIGKKLDALVKHGARRMGEIMGDDAQFYRQCLCVECFNTPGWLPPIDPTPDAQAFMYHWLGQHAPGDYQDDQHSKACEFCNGLGQVATGSKVAGQDYLPCAECKGLGWVATDSTRGGNILTTANGPQTATAAETVTPPVDPSEFDNLTVRELKARGGVVIPPFVPAG